MDNSRHVAKWRAVSVPDHEHFAFDKYTSHSANYPVATIKHLWNVLLGALGSRYDIACSCTSTVNGSS
jgi:hypothetical protein